jgi:hypothetical protein
MDIIKIENLLPDSYCNEIEQTLLGWDFPWGYNATLSYGASIDNKFIANDSKIKDTDGFVHTLFWGGEKLSPYADLVIPLLGYMEQQTNIKIQKIFRIRAVFVNKNETFGDFYNVPHIDDQHDHKNMIYYVNDSDGDTILFKDRFDGELNFNKKTEEHRISPKKNKAVVFDGFRYHSGSVPKINHRVLINFNFTVKK